MIESGSGHLPGAVPLAIPPKPLKFPVRGKTSVKETVTLAKAAAPVRKTGYDPATSRQVPPSGPDQVTYVNADGTRTLFDYE